jgi:lipoprotein-anchoring transpeptidase ErfK/SrfK
MRRLRQSSARGRARCVRTGYNSPQYGSSCAGPWRSILLCLMLWLTIGLPLAAAAVDEAPATAALTAGQYLWEPELAPRGPLVMLVSLPQQLAFVYRNGIRIGMTSISSGRAGFETPVGVYRILQKRREHYSNRYDAAPMPFMQRLTWDGVALHAGRVTGKPASHGCIRLPESFARKLYALTELGMIVVVADAATPEPVLAYPGFFAPIESSTGGRRKPLSTNDEGYSWIPERAGEGPLSIVISSSDRRMVVSKQGIEIGRCELRITPGTRFGLHAFVMLEGPGAGPHPLLPDRMAHRWQALSLPDHDPPGHVSFDVAALRQMGINPELAAAVDAALTPGTTVVITDDRLDPLDPLSNQAPGLLRTDEAALAAPVPAG